MTDRITPEARGLLRDCVELHDRERLPMRPEIEKACAFLEPKAKEFQAWAKIQAQKKMGIEAEIERKVDEMMKPENIRIEYGI
jgi:hypothetical protein